MFLNVLDIFHFLDVFDIDNFDILILMFLKFLKFDIVKIILRFFWINLMIHLQQK